MPAAAGLHWPACAYRSRQGWSAAASEPWAVPLAGLLSPSPIPGPRLAGRFGPSLLQGLGWLGNRGSQSPTEADLLLRGRGCTSGEQAEGAPRELSVHDRRSTAGPGQDSWGRPPSPGRRGVRRTSDGTPGSQPGREPRPASVAPARRGRRSQAGSAAGRLPGVKGSAPALLCGRPRRRGGQGQSVPRPPYREAGPRLRARSLGAKGQPGASPDSSACRPGAHPARGWTGRLSSERGSPGPAGAPGRGAPTSWS